MGVRITAARRMAIALGAIAAAMVAVPGAAAPQYDPVRALKGRHVGSPTSVLTVGSAHLAGMPHPVTPAMLAPLIDRLAAFKPDIVTTETISGEQCADLKRYPNRYPDAYATYCWDADEAQRTLGVDLAGAMAMIDDRLAHWPASPTPADRRRLAALFVAAGDRASAQVQWQRLAAGDRIAADGVDAVMLDVLNRVGGRTNEAVDLAVPIAIRAGLQRVYPVDDHTSDAVQGTAGPGFQPAIEKMWQRTPPPPINITYRDALQSVKDAPSLLAMYRLINRPAMLRQAVEADFGAALQLASPEHYGRQYVAWWEVRNLRMVANIRAAFGNRPGARVLNIVGSSHKPYYDAYLGMMHDVRIVDVTPYLK